MTQTTLSDFSSAPPMIDLETPTELQPTNDFQSDTTAILTQERPAIIPHNGLDTTRLGAFTKAPDKKRLRSPIWPFGWRLFDAKKQAYWLCRLCHAGPKKPKVPDGHVFATSTNTSSPILHLRREHSIRVRDDDFESVIERQSLPSNQLSISSAFSNVNEGSGPFDYEVFKGLLLQLFTQHQLPFQLVDQPAFRKLLTYCQPLLSDCVPRRDTLRRWIMSAYNHALSAVEAELARARTRINLSFDLWTSPGRKLALLGVVAHYLDNDFKPRAILLSLPSIKGRHTAVNVASNLSAIIKHFQLQQSFGHAITDNASENTPCMDILSEELNIPKGKRHVFCMGSHYQPGST